MKLVEIKQLKESDLFKKIIDELKVKGLENLYIKKTETVDYLDIILSIINFLQLNKNIFKRLNKDNYENLVIIVIIEILEEFEIETDEEQLEKIIQLLKNSLLVQQVSSFILNKLTLLFKKLKIFCCTSKQSLKDIQEIEESVPKKLVINVPDKLPKTKVPYPLTPLPSPRPL